MTDRDALLRRIEALLHHPPERSLTEGFEDEAEHEAAREHLGIVGLSPRFEREVDAADQVAAGANEYGFPRQTRPGREEGTIQVEWGNHPVLLRHPLSGAVLDLSDHQPPFTYPPTPAHDTHLRSTLEDALRAAVTASGGDHEKLALWLWRTLPDQLHRQDGNIPWHLLPAEPRIPDHSIWEHLSLTAALATAGLGPRSGADPGDWQGAGQPSTASLLLFTIGPVQGFVGAARKTRDLQAGSFLLSYLTWHAIRCVCEHFGPEAVLFPDLRYQPLVDRWLHQQGIPTDLHDSHAATIPNRFFAVVPDGQADDLALEASDAVRDEFARIAGIALNQLEQEVERTERWRGRVDWPSFEQQARDYFECYWTILPLHRFGEHDPGTFLAAFGNEYVGFFHWDDDDANEILQTFVQYGPKPNVGTVYGRLYRLTEALTGSRKALRDFTAVRESGYRCSLIPSLPAITPRADAGDRQTDRVGTPSTGDVNDFWDFLARRVGPGKLRKGEQLSVVALAKRFLSEYTPEDGTSMPSGTFPSTGSFATADFKADVIDLLTNKREAKGATEEERAQNRENVRAALATLRKTLKEPPEEENLTSLEKVAGRLDEEPLPLLKKRAGEDDLLSWLATLDGGWLFADGYDAGQIAKEYGFEETEKGSGIYHRTEGNKTYTQNQVKAAREVLGTFLHATDHAGIDRPSKYYAVLQMDGDDMGKWLSGQKAPRFADALHPGFIAKLRQRHENPAIEEDYKRWMDLLKNNPLRPLTPALHLAISRALGTFALYLVPRLTEEEHLGQRVYSGGDDVLAFASFRDALPLARRLRAAFSGQVREEEGEQGSRLETGWEPRSGYVPVDGHLRPTMGHTATASTGIVIAHYKHSLQHVFREAHQACEEYAKDDLKRNALAITVLKRSGERFQTGTKWHTISEEGTVETDLAETLERFADLVRKEYVASGYMYDLETEARGLSVFESKRNPDKNGLYPEPHDAVRREAYRLFLRRTVPLSRFRTTDPPPDLPLGHWLRDCMEKEAEKPEAERKSTPRLAWEATVDQLLTHNSLKRLITLLDAAQFIGQGGDR
ncbi:MAG: type III-B CRISPR-associated protein Cas10/Cmr2 [Rhodothermales bacterium]